MTSSPTEKRGRRHPALRGAAAAVAAFALFLLAAVAYSALDAIQGNPVRALGEGGAGLATPAVSSPDFVTAAGPLAGTVLTSGHGVEVLTDNRVFEKLLDDLAGAKRSITFYVYYCKPGTLGEALARVLADRARAGVSVLFMADGYACRDLVEAVRPELEAAGAEVALLRPVRWFALHRSQHRNHSRMVVVDGTLGYTGGFGFGDAWIGESPEGIPWRDTAVRFTGPAVRELQATFLAAWAEATGTLYAGEAFFPRGETPDTSTVVAGLLHSPPGIGTTPVERTFALTVEGAERTLHITNAYFVPTPPMRRLLLDAAARGVDVRILVPGPRTDVASTRWAGRSYYGELMAAGIRIFEYQETMMHAKTTVADGLWSSIGSMNLDNRSTRLNDEAALLVYDAGIGARLDSLFLTDLLGAHEVTAPEYRERPLRERFLEWATRLAAPVL